MQRAVKRGLQRRARQKPERLGIDETSFQKRHEYVTVITDPDKGTVIEVVDDRKKLGNPVLSSLKSIAMDMHAPFIAQSNQRFPMPEQF